jgi:hypothetical protein
MSKYTGTTIHQDGTLSTKTVDAEASTPIVQVRDRFDTGGAGDWFFLKRESVPGGKWVWEQWAEMPDLGGYEKRTVAELADRFGWTNQI